jgi:hypothetical protein
MVFGHTEFTHLWVNSFLSSEIKEAIDTVKIEAFCNVTSCRLVKRLLGLLAPKDDGTNILRKAGKYSPKDMVPTIRSFVSSAMPLRATQNSHLF